MAPEFVHWGFIRLAVMGGIISGYNYGDWGLGRNHTVGPVAAPLVMLEYKRVGANFILIRRSLRMICRLRWGFQVKVKF